MTHRPSLLTFSPRKSYAFFMLNRPKYGLFQTTITQNLSSGVKKKKKKKSSNPSPTKISNFKIDLKTCTWEKARLYIHQFRNWYRQTSPLPLSLEKQNQPSFIPPQRFDPQSASSASISPFHQPAPAEHPASGPRFSPRSPRKLRLYTLFSQHTHTPREICNYASAASRQRGPRLLALPYRWAAAIQARSLALVGESHTGQRTGTEGFSWPRGAPWNLEDDDDEEEQLTGSIL